METVAESKYKSPKYKIPYNEDLSKSDSEYYLKWCEAVYSYWIKGTTGITFTDTESFEKLRQYGEGRQPEGTYKNLLMGKPKTALEENTIELETEVDTGSSTTRDTKRRGYMNLLYDIVSPADKILGALIGKLSKVNIEISVDAIDPVSRDEQERKKFDMLRYMENREFEDKFRYMAGLPAEDPQFVPGDKEELDLWAEEGGFRTAYAIAMEEFANTTEELSSFDEIKDRMVADFINIGITGMVPYYDERSHTIRFKYADPELTIMQYSDYPDFRDSEYGGLFEFMPLSEFIQKAGIQDESKIDDILQMCSGKFNNPHLNDFGDYRQKMDTNGNYIYDAFKVLVLRLWWIDNDVKKDLVITNRHGNHKVRPFKEGQKGNVKERDTSIQKLYTAVWGVGTDYVVEYGEFKDMVRKNKNEVNFPQFMYKKPGRPTTKQIIPFYDALQINWLKYQDALATAKKAGYVIDYNAIANLKIGGGKNPEKEIIKRLIQTGTIVVKMTNIGGRPNTFQKPVYELTGGIGKQLEEFITAFEFNNRMIESFTGINPITLGNSADPNQPVRNMEVSVAGTDNILQVIVNSITRLQSKAHDYCMDWFQLSVKHNSELREVYKGIIGKDKVDAVRAATKHNALYGCFITPGINDQEIQEILEGAKISLQNGREGKPGITEADYALIIRMIKSKASSKYIFLMLDKRIKKAKAQAQADARETMVADRQAQAKNDQQKHQQEIDKLEREHRYKMDQITLEKDKELEIERVRLEGRKVEGVPNV